MAHKYIIAGVLALLFSVATSASPVSAQVTGTTTVGAPTTGASDHLDMTLGLLVASGALAVGSAIYMGRRSSKSEEAF